MSLYIIDTKHFKVVNVDDDDVSLVTPDDAVINEWRATNDTAIKVGEGATVIRIRALTGPEVESVDMSLGSTAFSLELAAKAVHEDDIAVFALLPWHYRRTLGGLVYKVSTFPLDLEKKPSSELQPAPKS